MPPKNRKTSGPIQGMASAVSNTGRSQDNGQGTASNPSGHQQNMAPHSYTPVQQSQPLTSENLSTFNETHDSHTKAGARGLGESSQRASAKASCNNMGFKVSEDVLECCLPGGHEGKSPMEHWKGSSCDHRVSCRGNSGEEASRN